MNERNDGGAAFARPYGQFEQKGAGKYSAPQKGMSLRDYFAAKAMIGMLSYPGDGNGSWHNNADPKDVAQFAYKYADAMLAEREK